MNDASRLFEEFIKLDTPDKKAEFLDKLLANAYTNLRNLTDQLTESIRKAEEADFPVIAGWIQQARHLIPDPHQISPYYQSVWDKLLKVLTYKQEAFMSFAQDHRDGEWQIVFNNPNTHDELLCIPSLTFTEACYMFAKYRTDLKQNEILRLQKVTDHLTTTGDR